MATCPVPVLNLKSRNLIKKGKRNASKDFYIRARALSKLYEFPRRVAKLNPKGLGKLFRRQFICVALND